MGRKALPIHETAPRDVQYLTIMNRRIHEVDSKHITDADREQVSKALQTIVGILEKVHRSYWNL